MYTVKQAEYLLKSVYPLYTVKPVEYSIIISQRKT